MSKGKKKVSEEKTEAKRKKKEKFTTYEKEVNSHNIQGIFTNEKHPNRNMDKGN